MSVIDNQSNTHLSKNIIYKRTNLKLQKYNIDIHIY